MHPDDRIVVIGGLEKLGHTVRTVKNHFFIDDRFRATIDVTVPTVHLTDLRTCN
jgi:hypothetical protein